MSTALVCTGIQFPDSTLQNTAAVSLTTVTYDNRSSLRTTTPSANLQSIVIQDLGVFSYYANNTEPDDDETCFVVSGSGGAWRIVSPTWDFIYSNLLPELENIYRLENAFGNQSCQLCCNYNTLCCLSQRWPGRVVGYCKVKQIVSCINPNSVLCQYPVAAACIPGARLGDMVIATPSHPCLWCNEIRALMSCNAGINFPPYIPFVAYDNCVHVLSVPVWSSACGGCCYMACSPLYGGTSTDWNIAVFRCN